MAWVSPTGHNDPDTQWSDEANAYDENTASYAKDSVRGHSWSAFLELTHAALWCDKLRFNADFGGAGYFIDVDVYDTAWRHVYEGDFADEAWVEKDLDELRQITMARVRLFNDGGLAKTSKLYEFDFNETSPPILYGEVSIQAVPSLTCTALRKRSAVCNISSTPSVVLTGNVIASGIVTIEAVAALYAKPTEVLPGECAISVVSAMAVSGNLIAAGEVGIDAVASLSAEPLRKRPGAVDIEAVSLVVALARRIRNAEVAIDITSSLSMASQLIASGQVSIDVHSSLALEAKAIRNAITTIQAVSSLTADPTRKRLAAAAIESTTSMSADGDAIRSGALTIEAVSSLLATALRKRGAEATIEAISSLDIDGDLIAMGEATIEAVASLIAQATRLRPGAAAINAVSSLLANANAVKSGVVEINATTALEITGLAYVAQCLGFTGTLTPGDVLEIDCTEDGMTVKLNGVNARTDFTGVFPKLYIGDNIIRWADDEEDRDVDIEIKHSPRYL